MIARHFPDWKLDIVGDGEAREALLRQIQTYGLEQQIALVYPTKEIEKIYLDASLLVLSSRYEGLPMVLLEAQSFGLPIVSFRCKCGPADIVTYGVNGFLVEESNIQELAKQMAVVMKNDDLRKRMGAKAKEASFRYCEDVVMQQWVTLFRSLMKI